MKNSAVIFLLVLFSLSAFAQKPKTAKNVSKTKLVKTVPESSVSEKEEFEKAVAQTDAAERVTALKKFVSEFPESEQKIHAQELIVSGRAQIADEKLRTNDIQSGIEIFKLAVKGIPKPISDKLFTEIILQIPTNIFFRGRRGAADEVAKLIEEKIDGNAKQLLGLATFYIGTENAAEAQRLADKAIELEPNFPAAYQTLGLANRLNFQLEDAANAYAKALELDNESIVSRRSLAEMKRAVGKPSEAVELYREILAKDAADPAAETGLILALFDADKRSEAEAEMAKSLTGNPNNLPLLVGAAYWYAAHENGAKAVELGQKAVDVEPRYTWAHIALARGLVQQKRLPEAERTLLAARQFGNFPTLDYELASVRLAAGFYREAANGLKKTFSVKNGEIQTKLGGRVAKQDESFIELLAAERRASIFEPSSADDAENAERLKSLLNFSQQLDSSNINREITSEEADNFVKGNDEMKLYRRLYAASRLLEKRTDVPKALELTQAAVGGVEAALNSPTAAAAVLADELYESRTLALSRNELVVVPDIPRQTLSKILRGRIEELTGWALYQQEKPDEAVTRFKRALSVLPEKSSWWRDSMWRLGLALQGEGKSDEALDAYFKSYTSGTPELSKRIIIEVLYQKINGTLDGLDDKIGVRPESAIADLPVQSEAVAQVTGDSAVESSPIPETETTKPENSPTPETKETPSIIIKTETSLTNLTKENPAKTEEKPNNMASIEPTPIPEDSPQTQIQSQVKETSEKAIERLQTLEPLPTPDIKTESTPESLPTPEELKTESTSENPPTSETKTEINNTKQVENQIAEVKPGRLPDSVFDPIIITVPKTEVSKKKETATSKVGSESSAVIPNKNSTEKITTKNTIEKNLSKTRPRIVGEEKTEAVQPCKIITSQESVSILNDGGSLGILVGFENGGDVKKIKSISSNPADVEITYEPEIGALSGRAFFIIKSVSRNKGIFTGIFEAPCGRKEITVKVR
ncbi:MAG: hypothetical protein ABI686_05345 [Acidobacteriota bacterium]